MTRVDARDVARRLTQLALGEPAGSVPDLAGPQIYGIKDLVGGYLAATGKHRPMLPVWMPGKVGRAYRAADNLTLTGATLGEHPWEEFLAAKTA